VKNKKDDEQKLKQIWHALNNSLHDAGIFIAASDRYLKRTDWRSLDREKLVETLTQFSGDIDRLRQKFKEASRASHEAMNQSYTMLGFEVLNKVTSSAQVDKRQVPQLGRSLKLLIVENEVSTLNGYVQVARDMKGFEIITATAYQQAKDLIESDKPDLILLDIYLNHPEFTGIDLLKQAKSVIGKCAIAVITGGTDSIVHTEALRERADKMCFKPILDYQSEITEIIEDLNGIYIQGTTK
jgi:CheY-like chemotaxis protein